MRFMNAIDARIESSQEDYQSDARPHLMVHHAAFSQASCVACKRFSHAIWARSLGSSSALFARQALVYLMGKRCSASHSSCSCLASLSVNGSINAASPP
jgi:hypothetical protein